MPDATTYYPLAVGNSWTYETKDGKTFTNSITAAEGDSFTMKNSAMPRLQSVRKDGEDFLADNFELDNFQVFLKDKLEKDDAWEVHYRANNIDNIMIMTVIDTGLTKEVAGETYDDVIAIEGDLRMKIQDNLVTTNFLVQYYYARGVGLILTTTSYGDTMKLISYEVQ